MKWSVNFVEPSHYLCSTCLEGSFYVFGFLWGLFELWLIYWLGVLICWFLTIRNYSSGQIKGIVYSKMKMSFILLLNSKEAILKNVGNQTVDGSRHTMEKKYTMEVNVYRQLFGYQHSTKYIILCSAEETNSYRFGMTWGWINEHIFIFFITSLVTVLI